MNLKYIEENYAGMSDREIEYITAHDAHSLRPEVIKIIENEIRKRNLNTKLIQGVVAQNKVYSEIELERYAEIIRKLPCPICGKKGTKLNGTVLHTVKSFVIVTITSKQTIIACPDCLNKEIDEANIITATLGLLGHGFFHVPFYLYRNYQAKKLHLVEYPNSTLLSFTQSNIGRIEINKDNASVLTELIKPVRK